MRRVPILMYHWFRADGTASNSRSPQLEMEPQLFARQMSYLKRHGWQGVTLREGLLQEPRTGARTRPVAITVDDGTLDFHELAWPILEEHGFHATLFVVTGHIGGTNAWDADLGEPSRPLMAWDQLLGLRDAGCEIAPHSHRHRVFTSLSDEAVLDEVTRSRDIVAEQTGQSPDFFAYPRGFYHARHRRIVRDAGYHGACAVALNALDLFRSDRYSMMRTTVKSTDSMFRFQMRLMLSCRVRHAPAD